MKKIINGKRYDTDVATIVMSASHGYAGDFSAWSASLYITPRSKSFFVAGRGGPMTRYAKSAGQNSWTGGSNLEPLTKTEALTWVEEHQNLSTDDTDEIVNQYFSDLITEA